MRVAIDITLGNPETAAEDLAIALNSLAEDTVEFGLDDMDIASITGHVKGQIKVEDL